MPKKAVKTPHETPMHVPEHGKGLLRVGGTNKGGGRKTDQWRLDCQQALIDAKGMDVVKEIISGDIYEVVGTDREGAPIYGQTKNSDRLGAIKFLASYAEGQPPQTIKVEDGSLQGLETAEQATVRLLAGMVQVLGVLEVERSQKALMLERLKGLEVSGEVVENGNGTGS